MEKNIDINNQKCQLKIAKEKTDGGIKFERQV